jgi:signal peptidase II
MSTAARITTLALVIAASVVSDQLTKVVAREHLQGQPTTSYLGDTFRLTFIENHGAFLGMGSSLPEGVRTAIFVVLVTAFLVALLVWALRTEDISRLAVWASALVVGGGIGNLIDRIVFNGGVTDFLNMGIGPVRTGIFNVADVWIMVGVGLLLISPEMRKPKPSGDADEAGDDAAETVPSADLPDDGTT